MIWKVKDLAVTDGNTEPVTLQQAKDWLRVDSEDDDALITDLITVARKRIERFTGVSMVDKDIVCIVEISKEFPLPYPAFDEIDTVKRWVGTEWETLSADDYILLGSYTATFRPNVAGLYEIAYSTTANTDTSLKLDLKRVLLWLYENRGDDSDNMPMELMSNAKQKRVLSWV